MTWDLNRNRLPFLSSFTLVSLASSCGCVSIRSQTSLRTNSSLSVTSFPSIWTNSRRNLRTLRGNDERKRNPISMHPHANTLHTYTLAHMCGLAPCAHMQSNIHRHTYELVRTCAHTYARTRMHMHACVLDAKEFVRYICTHACAHARTHAHTHASRPLAAR